MRFRRGKALLRPSSIAGALLTLMCGLMPACVTMSPPTRIALLAPFEGRYREVGYNALYATRMALHDAGADHIELLAVDDGGTPDSAADRARALQDDPQVMAVLILGHAASSSEVLNASGDLAMLIVGDWGAQPVDDRVLILTNPAIDDQLSLSPQTAVTEAARRDAPIIGGDSLALTQLSHLRTRLEEVTILSSAALPDPDFAERYRSSDQFAPEPGLLASLTYDAARMLIETAGTQGSTRESIREKLSSISYTGLNGTIALEHGYWANASIYRYGYDSEGVLLPVDNVVK